MLVAMVGLVSTVAYCRFVLRGRHHRMRTDAMGIVMDIVIPAALVVSGIFGLVGSYGLVRPQGQPAAPARADQERRPLGVAAAADRPSMTYFFRPGTRAIQRSSGIGDYAVSVPLDHPAPVSPRISIAKTYLARNGPRRPSCPPASPADYGWAALNERSRGRGQRMDEKRRRPHATKSPTVSTRPRHGARDSLTGWARRRLGGV